MIGSFGSALALLPSSLPRTHAERRALGVAGHAVFQSVDDPNDVTVWHDFSTAQSAKDFASSPRLKEVMEKAGVKGRPQIWFVDQAN